MTSKLQSLTEAGIIAQNIHTEVENLIADTKKTRKSLGWNPRITFEDLAKVMVDADMRSICLKPIGEGDKIIKKKFPIKWWKGD